MLYLDREEEALHEKDPIPRYYEGVEKEAVLAKIAALSRKGWPQYKIAEAIGRSPAAVHEYMKIVRERYRTAIIGSVIEGINEQLEQLRDLREEAWTKINAGHRDAAKMMQIVAECLRDEAKLKRLLDPDVHLHIHKDAEGEAKFDWDALLKRGDAPNDVDAEVESSVPVRMIKPHTNGTNGVH